jgi:hypothetical protein
VSFPHVLIARCTRSTLLAAAATSCAVPLVTKAETRLNVDVSAGATAASNPYLLDGEDTQAIGANLTIDPSIFLEDEDTSIVLDGSLSLEKFFRRYGFDESIALAASGEHRVDERTTLAADLGFRSSESAARRFFGGPDLVELEPGEFPDSGIIDPTLGNLGGRTNRLDVNASVKHLTGPDAVLTASAGLGLTRVESDFGLDYRDSTFAVSYAKQLTTKTSFLGTVNAGYADYLGRRAGDGIYVTALAGGEHRFSESLYVSGQLGASLSAVESLASGRRTTVSWAGEFDLCDRGERATICVRGSRSAQPTSLGGLTTVSSVGASYAHSFGRVASASVMATYARSSRFRAASSLVGSTHTELIAVSGSYRHTLGQRLSAFVTPSFTSVANEFSGRQENYQMLLGVSYHLGRMR